jgi:histidine ammonia-lyase
VRESIPFMPFDRAMDGDVQAAVRLVTSGRVLAAARRGRPIAAH